MHPKPVLGISIGDLNGVGPEVVVKTFSDSRVLERCTPVIFASSRLVNTVRKSLPEITFSFNTVKDFNQLDERSVNVFSCWEEDVPLNIGQLTDAGGKYAVRSLMVATQCLKDQQVDALITAPLHKANTQLPDFPHTGHTPFLKDAFQAKDVVMMLCSDQLRVALATEHVPIEKVASLITKDLLVRRLNIIRESLIRDFGIDKPRIAVLGLNPHAGDEGRIGKEEEEVIKPLMEELQTNGQLVFGPYSADAFFARHSYLKFDAVLAMYHDQGLIPFKTLAEHGGVNYTAGLPVVRTSPDHGTAFDIAGKDMADPGSFREAVFFAIDVLRQRKAYATNTANPLTRGKVQKERY